LIKLNEDELAELLTNNADEPQARDLATAILEAHANRPLTTTRALAAVIKTVAARQHSADENAADNTVRRVFQALRIAVNDEFGALNSFLRNLPFCMQPGGRIAILTFHSGEDRRVKESFKSGYRDGLYSKISEEVTRASFEEQRSNPRASSAKLRYAIRS
jgi:16S rRNA (cytosine1402-N4)-methyltransferase